MRSLFIGREIAGDHIDLEARQRLQSKSEISVACISLLVFEDRRQQLIADDGLFQLIRSHCNGES